LTNGVFGDNIRNTGRKIDKQNIKIFFTFKFSDRLYADVNLQKYIWQNKIKISFDAPKTTGEEKLLFRKAHF